MMALTPNSHTYHILNYAGINYSLCYVCKSALHKYILEKLLVIAVSAINISVL